MFHFNHTIVFVQSVPIQMVHISPALVIPLSVSWVDSPFATGSAYLRMSKTQISPHLDITSRAPPPKHSAKSPTHTNLHAVSFFASPPPKSGNASHPRSILPAGHPSARLPCCRKGTPSGCRRPLFAVGCSRRKSAPSWN